MRMLNVVLVATSTAIRVSGRFEVEMPLQQSGDSFDAQHDGEDMLYFDVCSFERYLCS